MIAPAPTTPVTTYSAGRKRGQSSFQRSSELGGGWGSAATGSAALVAGAIPTSKMASMAGAGNRRTTSRDPCIGHRVLHASYRPCLAAKPGAGCAYQAVMVARLEITIAPSEVGDVEPAGRVLRLGTGRNTVRVLPSGPCEALGGLCGGHDGWGAHGTARGSRRQGLARAAARRLIAPGARGPRDGTRARVPRSYEMCDERPRGDAVIEAHDDCALRRVVRDCIVPRDMRQRHADAPASSSAHRQVAAA